MGKYRLKIVMATTFKTIVKPEVQNVLDHFCFCMDIRMILYTPKGEIMKVGRNSPDSNFCLHIRKLYGNQRCHVLDETMRKKALKEERQICYICHGGLNESIEPIFVRGVLIGYAMIGQFRSNDTISKKVLSHWKMKNYDVSELQRAFMELPVYDREKQDHIFAMFRVLVEYIISKEMLSTRGNQLFDRIEMYLKENIHKTFTLGDVAGALGVSKSTISHGVRKYGNQSFKQLYTEAKVREAERLMRNDPDITVGEVADALGFADQFYFSRLFKNSQNISPSEFKRAYHLSN
jgi:AraC-like DNA-binding protein